MNDMETYEVKVTIHGESTQRVMTDDITNAGDVANPFPGGEIPEYLSRYGLEVKTVVDKRVDDD